ncbi:hypothetical protein REPUB_Repub12eG0005800 [Reevesia pubescens]
MGDKLLLPIDVRNWEIFVTQPKLVVLTVVREFYANAMEHQNGKVFVRGKWVSFDRSTINRYYRLPNIVDNEYHQQKDKFNWEEVSRTLCKLGIRWNKSQEGYCLSFPRSALDKHLKAWNYFIGAKMMPNRNFNLVLKKMVGLLYVIQLNIPVDVGLVIQNSIIHAIETLGVSLFFPSLITTLCKNAEIVWQYDEEIL